MPYIVAQVEIAGHSHLCPRKARRRPSRRAAGRLAVTSVAQDKRVTAALPPPRTPEESGRAETRVRDPEARGGGGGAGRGGRQRPELCFTRVGSILFSKFSRSSSIRKAKKCRNMKAFVMGLELRFASRSDFSGLQLSRHPRGGCGLIPLIRGVSNDKAQNQNGTSGKQNPFSARFLARAFPLRIMMASYPTPRSR